MYVFTTRADTIMGVTFCAVAPEHRSPPARSEIPGLRHSSTNPVRLGDRGRQATMEKKGMPTGLYVRHPITSERSK